jgi:hypothetical protein
MRVWTGFNLVMHERARSLVNTVMNLRVP